MCIYAKADKYTILAIRFETLKDLDCQDLKVILKDYIIFPKQD